jgi:hypothetical protein
MSRVSGWPGATLTGVPWWEICSSGPSPSMM